MWKGHRNENTKGSNSAYFQLNLHCKNAVTFWFLTGFNQCNVSISFSIVCSFWSNCHDSSDGGTRLARSVVTPERHPVVILPLPSLWRLIFPNDLSLVPFRFLNKYCPSVSSSYISLQFYYLDGTNTIPPRHLPETETIWLVVPSQNSIPWPHPSFPSLWNFGNSFGLEMGFSSPSHVFMPSHWQPCSTHKTSLLRLLFSWALALNCSNAPMITCHVFSPPKARVHPKLFCLTFISCLSISPVPFDSY